jgi:hypothetical protein
MAQFQIEATRHQSNVESAKMGVIEQRDKPCKKNHLQMDRAQMANARQAGKNLIEKVAEERRKGFQRPLERPITETNRQIHSYPRRKIAGRVRNLRGSPLLHQRGILRSDHPVHRQNQIATNLLHTVRRQPIIIIRSLIHQINY